jgi:uncharacterized DUF497 family protein
MNMELRFEWDEAKAASNLEKHGVGFEEAQTVLNDPHAITIFDHLHSGDEDRFVDIGLSMHGRVVVVVYTERGERIRIVSSRLAAPLEQHEYEQSHP